MMEGYYLFFRHWPGYTRTFPYQRFNGLPDDEVGRALDEYARSWIEEHPEEWARRDHELMARAGKQPSLPDPKDPGPFPRGEVPLGQLIYEVGLTARWIEKLPSAICHTPLLRICFRHVPTELLAQCATRELQKRLAYDPRNVRFGYLPVADFDVGQRASIGLKIRELTEGPIYPDSLTALLDEHDRELASQLTAVVDLLEESMYRVAEAANIRENAQGIDAASQPNESSEQDSEGDGTAPDEQAPHPHLDATDKDIIRFLRGFDRETKKLTGEIAHGIGRPPRNIGKNLAKLHELGLLDNTPKRQGYLLTPSGWSYPLEPAAS